MNPSRHSAHHVKQSTFKGSDRQIRGQVIKVLVKYKKLTKSQLKSHLQNKLTTAQLKRIQKQLTNLEKEGFIIKKQKYFSVAQ